MNKVAVVVVTFNRLSLLKGCVESLRKQTKKIDEILIVNNGSTDGTEAWLAEQNDLLIFHQPNTGGAGGFNRGMMEAYDRGNEWIWVMDDDCFAIDDCLENMFLSINKSKSMFCVAPMVVDNDGKVDVRHRGYFNLSLDSLYIQTPIDEVNVTDITIDFASFVGLMINSSAIKIIGLPKKELFIHNDDVEYCLRLNKISKIVLSTKAKIFHLENAIDVNVNKKFLNHSRKRPPIDKLWIRYYGVRNLIWIKKVYIADSSFSKKVLLFIYILKSLYQHLKDIMLYDDFKFARLTFYLHAYSDGWFGNFDNGKPKRILSKYL